MDENKILERIATAKYITAGLSTEQAIEKLIREGLINSHAIDCIRVVHTVGNTLLSDGKAVRAGVLRQLAANRDKPFSTICSMYYAGLRYLGIEPKNTGVGIKKSIGADESPLSESVLRRVANGEIKEGR
jgi:hypothetical protein